MRRFGKQRGGAFSCGNGDKKELCMSKVAVVGAGIAGLIAGVYAQKSGFEVKIFESHSVPGGNCTCWRRQGYLFEGGMHWLTGSSPKEALHQIWRDSGAIDDDSVIMNYDPVLACDCRGQEAGFYRDMEKFESHLCGISPEDAPLIREMLRDVRRCSPLRLPILNIPGLKTRVKSTSLWDLVKMLPSVLFILGKGNISVADYCKRFQNPAIQLLMSSVISPEYEATSLFFTLARYLSGDGGYVEGGSLEMTKNMVKRLESLGGEIRYNKAVEKVIVKDGRAAGVLTCDGETVPADAVIIASDTLAAVDDLFETPLHEPWMDLMRKKTLPLMSTFFSIGIKADLSFLAESVAFNLSRPFDYGGRTVSSLILNNYARHKGYAPDGCTAATCIIEGDSYEYWKTARERGTYGRQKKELYETILDRMEEQFPVIKGKVEVWDLATPLTYERFVKTFRGSWMTKTLPGQKRVYYPHKSRDIKNLYFAGQRIIPPGGLPVAAATGRTAAQHLCRDFGRVFG
jgi:phytoene dehydrogenase-like protein